MGHLSDMGLIGWGHLEVAILAGLVRKKPLLFIGMHGGNKTEGSAALCRASTLYARKNVTEDLKKSFRFATYDAALLTIDDIVGLLNTKTLGDKNADGTDKLEFIETPHSVWRADAALLDEITRADRGIAGKLMEFVRTGKVMGKQTAVKQVMAAANPPREYDAIYMDQAFASRFMILNVPDARTMDESDFDSVVSLGIRGSDKIEATKRERAEARLGSFIRKARLAVTTEADEREALGFAKEVRRIIVGDPRANPPRPGIKELKVSLRQFQEIAATYIAIKKLQAVGGLPKKIDQVHVAEAVMSWIPETTGAIKTSFPKNGLLTSIGQVVERIASGDIVAPMALEEVLKLKANEPDVWGTSVVDAIKAERNPMLAAKAARITRVREKRKKVSTSVTNMVMDATVQRMVELGRKVAFEPQYARNPVGYKREGLIEAIGSLFEQRDKPKLPKKAPKSGLHYGSSFANTDEQIRTSLFAAEAAGGPAAAAAVKVLVACDDKKYNDLRIFGPRIPVIAMTKVQFNRERNKLTLDKHVVMVYVSPTDSSDIVMVEMHEDNVRVNATKRDPVVNQGEYHDRGIHFMWGSRGSVRLPEKAYMLTAIMVDPTVQDLLDAELLPLYLQSSAPDPLCKRARVQTVGNKYVPEYAKLFPSLADV